jgi:ATP-binding protein involved in chromosome partitioning
MTHDMSDHVARIQAFFDALELPSSLVLADFFPHQARCLSAQWEGGRLALTVELPLVIASDGALRQAWQAEAESALRAKWPELRVLQWTVTAHDPGRSNPGVEAPSLKKAPAHIPRYDLPSIGRVMAVGSGKGGVGKSTMAVNLAVASALAGYRTGLVDADIYGPSVPMMMGIMGEPTIEGQRFQPWKAYGVSVMSMGGLLGEQTAAVWRGPMISKALHQLMMMTQWGDLDVLWVDLPPGTGDILLSLMERYPVAGMVAVSGPSEVMLADAKRLITMAERMAIPVVGMVENMVRPGRAAKDATPVRRHAEGLSIPYLGALPWDGDWMDWADRGLPAVIQDPAVRVCFQGWVQGLLDGL